MMLLVKQGVTSQKTRNGNTVGNLAQVTQNVGQNMTDISRSITADINHHKRSPSPASAGSSVPRILLSSGIPTPPRLKDRGNSLPPPLPRPPRSLKPPRKIEYGRIEPSDYCKKRSQTPPMPTQQEYQQMKSSTYSSSSKRTLADTMKFSQKHKNYGTIFHGDDKTFGFKPEYNSTRNYHRFGEPTRKTSNTLRKHTAQDDSRDSLNSASSESNNSNTPVRSSPVHTKTDSNSSTSTYQQNMSSSSKPTPSIIANARNKIQQFNQKASSLPSSSTLHKKAITPTSTSSSLPPPKPSDNSKGQKQRVLVRGENRYRIMQF